MMDTVRLAAFADLHLGKKKGPGIGWAREELSRAVDEGAQAIVFTGDLLDKKKSRPADLADAVDLFTHVTATLGRPLIHVWGNHDVGSGFIPEFPEIPGVHRPRGGEIAEIRLPGIPLLFHAANVTADPDPRDVVTQFPAAHGPGHVGVLHSGVEGRFTKNPCLPTTPGDLLTLGYGAWLLGHVHQPTQLSLSPWIGWVGMGRVLLIDVPALPGAS